MAKKVKLYDPHSGIGGPIVPLPTLMKKTIDSLDNKELTLEEVVEELTPVAEKLGGRIDIDKDYKFVGFSIKEKNNVEHYWRLIRYK